MTAAEMGPVGGSHIPTALMSRIGLLAVGGDGRQGRCAVTADDPTPVEDLVNAGPLAAQQLHMRALRPTASPSQAICCFVRNLRAKGPSGTCDVAGCVS